jgi:hypothetical protein
VGEGERFFFEGGGWAALLEEPELAFCDCCWGGAGARVAGGAKEEGGCFRLREELFGSAVVLEDDEEGMEWLEP